MQFLEKLKLTLEFAHSMISLSTIGWPVAASRVSMLSVYAFISCHTNAVTAQYTCIYLTVTKPSFSDSQTFSLKSNFTCSAHRNKLVKQTRTLVTDNKWLSDSQFWSKISCNDRKQTANVTWLTVSHGSQWRLRLERHSEASYIKKWI